MTTPQTMRALIQTAYGPASTSLELRTVPLPPFDPSSDQLLLRVRAVSVNPVDSAFVKGTLKMIFDDPLPAGLGCDVSGVVVRAGNGTGFKEGDEVYGCMKLKDRGSMAEYCTIPASSCALKPTTLTHEQAACLPVVGLTALQALQRHTGRKEVAFIPAGLGGVGSIALQLAKPYAGFKHTITTASTAKVPLVKQHVKDVDEVIDYKTVDPAQVIPAGSCDFVLDQFGKPASYVRYLRKPSSSSAGKAKQQEQGKPSIISILAPPNAEKAQKQWEKRVGFVFAVALNLLDWWTRLWIPGYIHYDSFFAVPNGEDMRVLTRLADEGRLRPVVDKVYPFEQAVEAILRAESKPAGKVVIKISE